MTCLGKNLEWTFPSWWFMARHPVCIHCSITQSPPLVPPSRLRECDDHNCSALWKRLPWVSVWQHVRWAAVKRIGHGCWSRRSAWVFEFCTSTSVAPEEGQYSMGHGPLCNLTDIGPDVLLPPSSPGISCFPSGISFIYCFFFCYTVMVILNYLRKL